MKDNSIKKRRTILFGICLLLCIGITVASVVYFSSNGTIKKTVFRQFSDAIKTIETDNVEFGHIYNDNKKDMILISFRMKSNCYKCDNEEICRICSEVVQAWDRFKSSDLDKKRINVYLINGGLVSTWLTNYDLNSRMYKDETITGWWIYGIRFQDWNEVELFPYVEGIDTSSVVDIRKIPDDIGNVMTDLKYINIGNEGVSDEHMKEIAEHFPNSIFYASGIEY